MSEPGFREIQLNTKQVVFLFIAGLAVLVGIFLLGVQAGRGVSPERAGETVQAPDPAADVTASGVMPPATSPKPDELKYHDELPRTMSCYCNLFARVSFRGAGVNSFRNDLQQGINC